MLSREIWEEKGHQARASYRPKHGQKASPMRLSALRRRTIRQARREYHRGRLTGTQLTDVYAVVEDRASLVKLNDRVERDVNPWNDTNDNTLYGADGRWQNFFKNVWDWFVENWPTILSIILKLAPLLILENADEDS